MESRWTAAHNRNIRTQGRKSSKLGGVEDDQRDRRTKEEYEGSESIRQRRRQTERLQEYRPFFSPSTCAPKSTTHENTDLNGVGGKTRYAGERERKFMFETKGQG